MVRTLTGFLKFSVFIGLLTLLVGCGEEPKYLYGPFGPTPVYGVLECVSDDQCEDVYGDNWYCNSEDDPSFCESRDGE